MPDRLRMWPRVTLTQLLVSIAILTLPMALYATELQGFPGRRVNITLLLISLAAHCVELEAFFWLIVAPGIGRLLARGRTPGVVSGPEERVSKASWMSRVLLLFGPCYAVIVPLGGWGFGYRGGYLGLIFGLVFVLLLLPSLALIPVGLLEMIVRLIKRSRYSSRPIASFVLLLLTLPCNFSFWTAFNVGWGQLESEIGLPQLGRECVSIFESPEVQCTGEVPKGLLQTVAKRRLRPTRVNVAAERYLTIELGGGFNHYGYYLKRDTSNQRWELLRSGGSTAFGPDMVEPLLTWPIGSEP
jgi:hypothetical protein